LTVSGGDASAQFFSPNPVVRDAIDAALPKLRELMAQAGISLGETEVRDQAFSQRENLEMQGRRTAQSAEINPQPSALAAIGVVKSAGLGLVDLYI
jgi:flagellar hook-length control protein FliK